MHGQLLKKQACWFGFSFITCVTTRHRWGPSGICNSNRDCCCPIKIMPGLVCVQFPAKYPQRITFIFLYFYFWHLHMHTSAQLIQNPPLRVDLAISSVNKRIACSAFIFKFSLPRRKYIGFPGIGMKSYQNEPPLQIQENQLKNI